MKAVLFCILTLFPLLAQAPEPASINAAIDVDATSNQGPVKPIWAYFGYDEPNYTYAPNGVKLITELSSMGHVPVYFRTHNLLTSGDGQPSLKWGSTNAYTEDAQGKPVYDWTLVDRIIDTYLHAKARPFVEIGFMPEALASKPVPYRHNWPATFSTGWASPPADYLKWRELVYQWARHAVEKYGEAEVNSWYWEVWNEPNIGYWQGTPEDYDKLYDYAVDAVRRAAPHARVGGPATTGPASEKAAAFLRQFLLHCDRGTNFATGGAGAPLDFVTYHAKGNPQLVDGHVRMGIARNLSDVSAGMDVLAAFPKFRDLPIILSESDPEGCAACSAKSHPENAYRNGPLYSCYTAAMLGNLFRLADIHHANLEGMLTWAFEFEGQPYFEGFRTLATNGIDKPVLNVFRMAALLHGDRLSVKSARAIDAETIQQAGVRSASDIDAVASRSGRDVTIMAWNYHDDDVAGPVARVDLSVRHLPASVKVCRVRHFRIDQDHSNAFAAWKQLGSPAVPTREQYVQLEAAGKLQPLQAEQQVVPHSGTVALHFSLPRQAVSLLQIDW